jgi:hypothetical protein
MIGKLSGSTYIILQALIDHRMPPVDAVYRPHVVHHTIVPPEIKAQQVQRKTKRYFVVE